MIRSFVPAAAALVVLGAALSACGGGGAPDGGALGLARNTNSPIAGETLRCAGDYPDSALVFGRDGSLSGRYAGRDVSGEWTALAPGTVEVMFRSGGIAVRDTMQQTGSGWRGQNTACG